MFEALSRSLNGKNMPHTGPCGREEVGQGIASQVGQNSGRKRSQIILIQFQRVGSPTCKKSFGHLHKVFILEIPPGIVTSLVPGQSDSQASVIESVNSLHTYLQPPL